MCIGWAGEDDLDLDEELATVSAAQPKASAAAAAITLPSAGTARPELWARQSTCAADLVAAGQFDVALRLLHEQIGLISAAPLKATVTAIFRARAALLPMNGGLPPLRAFLERSADNARDANPRLVRAPLSLTAFAHVRVTVSFVGAVAVGAD